MQSREEVSAAAPMLQTQTTDVGTVMEAHSIENLPLQTRNYNQLTLLVPGAVTISPASFNTGKKTFNAARPNVVGNPNGKHCASGTLFNTCAFVTNTISGSFGNAGRNIIRGPGFQNWDLSLFKTFPINENRRLEFRAEFFNAFNHVNPEFSNPNNIAENIATENGSPGFGFAQAARDPRFIQFALKFYF